MNCPQCGRSLTPVRTSGITVDACWNGCGGIWFDQGELQKVDEPHEAAGESLLEIPRAGGAAPDRSRRLRCPRCPDTVLMRHLFSPKRAVVVDECPTCGGYWLDPGELLDIRWRSPREGGRKAVQAYFDDVLGERPGAAPEPGAAPKPETGVPRRYAGMFRLIGRRTSRRGARESVTKSRDGR